MKTFDLRPAPLLFVAALIALAPAPPGRAADSAAANDPVAAAATPGPEHRTLAALAGEFDLTSTFWPDPAAPPSVSRLAARREIVLGGRALRLDVGPDERGFHGTGLMGYDNVAERFWYVWTDTSTTGLSVLDGRVDSRGAGTLEGTLSTPYGPSGLRVVSRFEDGVEIHDYYVPAATGEGETRILELRYLRRPLEDRR